MIELISNAPPDALKQPLLSFLLILIYYPRRNHFRRIERGFFLKKTQKSCSCRKSPFNYVFLYSCLGNQACLLSS